MIGARVTVNGSPQNIFQLVFMGPVNVWLGYLGNVSKLSTIGSGLSSQFRKSTHTAIRKDLTIIHISHIWCE